jgi:hypothetical protein
VTFSFFLSACSNTQEADPALFEGAREMSLSNIKEAELIQDRSFSIGSYGSINDIGAVTADEDGNVYVVNDYNKRIEVFDRTGNNIESLGGLGSDPGDYRDPAYLKVQGDHLYAFDNSLNRAYKYRLPEMELSTMTELEGALAKLNADSLNSAKPVRLEVTAEGNYLVGFQIVKSTEDRRLMYYEVNENGDVVSDEILNVPNRKLHVDRAVDPPLIMMMPYEPEQLIQTNTRGRIYNIDTGHFLVTVMDSRGQEVETRYYSMERQPLIRSEVVDMYTDTFRRRAIRRASLPDSWPALSHALVDDQDRLWVASIGPDSDIYQWYILSPNGEPLASFDLSREKQIEAVVGDTVYIKSFEAGQYSDQVKRYTLNF